MEAALAWCRSEQIDCLYFLADVSNPTASDLAQKHQFRLVDIRLTLSGTAPAQSTVKTPKVVVRPAIEGDIDDLKAIARVSHQDSRFFADQRFPRERCEALYAVWIEKSVRGSADAVLVATVERQARGYAACRILQPTAGQIGLLAVAPNAHRQGIGQTLLAAAMDWFYARGIERVSVVTQGRNIYAQRLYQRAGFLTESIYLWYHAWLNPAQAAGL
jgi:TDP-D-fucosamine acetyltransferase